MTNWTTFPSALENGVFVTTSMLRQIINNTSNIYERVVTLQNLNGSGVPIGAVMLWKGNVSTIPTGFQLANGTNGTPDLRGCFVTGIAPNEDDDDLTGTGGETSHANAVGTLSNASKHKHTVYLNDSTAFVSAQSGVGLAPAMAVHNHDWSAETSSEDEHTHTGTYTAADHLPPYTKYYWIVRIPA